MNTANKTQKETEDAILKLIDTLIENATVNNAVSVSLGFQALRSFIETNAHFDESYVEQLRAFVPGNAESIRN
jgi:hypothetical protein